MVTLPPLASEALHSDRTTPCSELLVSIVGIFWKYIPLLLRPWKHAKEKKTQPNPNL